MHKIKGCLCILMSAFMHKVPGKGRNLMKDKIFGVLQRVGRSFMLPIAILPVAGLLLGVGGSFTNETMLNTYGLMGIMGCLLYTSDAADDNVRV